jgi:hypothetical protein
MKSDHDGGASGAPESILCRAEFAAPDRCCCSVQLRLLLLLGPRERTRVCRAHPSNWRTQRMRLRNDDDQRAYSPASADCWQQPSGLCACALVGARARPSPTEAGPRSSSGRAHNEIRPNGFAAGPAPAPLVVRAITKQRPALGRHFSRVGLNGWAGGQCAVSQSRQSQAELRHLNQVTRWRRWRSGPPPTSPSSGLMACQTAPSCHSVCLLFCHSFGPTVALAGHAKTTTTTTTTTTTAFIQWDSARCTATSPSSEWSPKLLINNHLALVRLQ